MRADVADTPSTRHPPCSLAALGLVTCLGDSLDETWPRLVGGDQSRFAAREDLIPGEQRLFAQVQTALPEIPHSLSRFACRNNQLALAALEAIRSDVQQAISRYGSGRIAVVVGTSTSGIAEAEGAFRERGRSAAYPPGFDYAQVECGGLAEFVARVAGVEGPRHSLSTACSSGAKALASARTLLELDVCDAVIAGACDSLCRMTANGFGSLQALSKGVSNPMSRNRDGINLGEGAALFLLTRERGPIQLVGAGESNDAHHMSAPEPRGRGAEECMRAALANAGLEPGAISYLNLHGTGTQQNDAMESAAVDRVFGRSLPCSSTKPLVGHTLGASGAIEAAFCWLVLARRSARELRLPPHRWDGQRDAALAPLDLVPQDTLREAPSLAILMSNSFGFGGSNCALVIAEGSG